MDEDEVVAALDGFDELWDSLSPREREVLALLVSRIEFDVDESIAVTFQRSVAQVIAEQNLEDAA